MNEVALAIQALLTSALNGYTVVYGQMLSPAESDLPLIEVLPRSTQFVPMGTGGIRENRFFLDIRLSLSLKDYIQDDTDVSIQTHLQDLVKVMEERDSQKKPKVNTILGVLNSNLSLNNTVHNVILGSIEYGNITNSNESYLRQATLSLEATLTIPTC